MNGSVAAFVALADAARLIIFTSSCDCIIKTRHSFCWEAMDTKKDRERLSQFRN